MKYIYRSVFNADETMLYKHDNYGQMKYVWKEARIRRDRQPE